MTANGVDLLTFTLRNGMVVLARKCDFMPTYPMTYANRTQAQKAADKIPGATVWKSLHSRPFYVALPTGETR